MAPSARIATFLVGLTVVFGATFGLGRAVGPVGSSDGDRDPVHTEHPAGAPAPASHAEPEADQHGGGSRTPARTPPPTTRPATAPPRTSPTAPPRTSPTTPPTTSRPGPSTCRSGA